MEKSKFKYDGFNDRWLYSVNGRDATEEIEKIKAERAEQRRLYAEYGGTASRIIDDCKNWRDGETTIIEFKYAIMEKIDECLQSKQYNGIQEFKRIEHKDNVIIDDDVISKQNGK